MAKVVYLSMPVILAAILNFWHVDICMPPRPQTITQSVAKVHAAPAEIQFLWPTDICRRLARAVAKSRATFAKLPSISVVSLAINWGANVSPTWASPPPIPTPSDPKSYS